MATFLIAAAKFSKERSKLIVIGTAILAVVLSWHGCSRPAETEHRIERIIHVGGTKAPNRRADVIFVHGLGGDAKSTWQGGNAAFFWPESLGKKFPDIGVWSISYDAYPSEWLGGTMPIVDRSKALLELIRLNELGTRPVVFVGHSLGGIVVKQILRDAFTQNNDDWEGIGDETEGVVFLGNTAHRI